MIHVLVFRRLRIKLNFTSFSTLIAFSQRIIWRPLMLSKVDGQSGGITASPGNYNLELTGELIRYIWKSQGPSNFFLGKENFEHIFIISISTLPENRKRTSLD